MNILCIGDVVGSVGCEFLRRRLPSLKRVKGIDFVIANGENSADTNGITPTSAEFLLSSGVDAITTGNHTYQRREMYGMYDQSLCILRPANYPSSAPGRGMAEFDLGRYSVCVINLSGQYGMGDYLDNPFFEADRLLKNTSCRTIIVDFHAESTAEKRALAEYLCGRVSAVFGTHTHVQTADEQILGGHTGFITDVGMTGPINSVIGSKPEAAIAKFTTKMPTRLEYAGGDCMLCGILFTIDPDTGRTACTERIDIR